MAGEVKSITSESLEAAYRALTPSQSGFTQDLQASNTIIPVLDLTADAQGTSTPQYLQTALAFGSQTGFVTENTTTNLASSPGFWQVTGSSVAVARSGTTGCSFSITDGLSSKQVWGHSCPGVTTAGSASAVTFNLIFFLRAGDTLSVTSDNANALIEGSYRQVADVNGVLVNPSGFTPQ
jgi:hypothetical protein